MIRPSLAHRLGTSVAINANFFCAAGFALTAWMIWPDSAAWWGLGLISVLLGLASLGCGKTAITMMIRRYEYERAVAVFETQGAGPKSSHTATHERMRRAGMIDE